MNRRNVFLYLQCPWPAFCLEWWLYYMRFWKWGRVFKWSWQRLVRGWADCDVWNFDGHLAQIIAGGVDYLRDQGMGFPSDLSNSEWRRILTEISEGLRVYNGYKYDWPVDKEKERKFREALHLFSTYFENLWD